MAIFGTLLNFAIIGLGLRLGAELLWHQMTVWHCFTFASIVSAIDPVAVLAIFEAVDADRALYFLVQTLLLTLITTIFPRSSVKRC